MLIIGHRGASHDHAENTLAAFRGARDQGADGIELDVRRTQDGVLVVHHDPHLADGRVISTLRADELHDEVPTLSDALAECADLFVNVEIKHGDDQIAFHEDRRLADQTIECWAALPERPDILISSFDFAIIERVKAIDPAIPTGYLVLGVDDPHDAVARCVAGGHQAVNPWDPMVDEGVARRCLAAGLELNVWTVDDPERIAVLAGWGVTSVITNRPALARAALPA